MLQPFINNDIIKVAHRLGLLREKVVFLGGAVTGLLITDAAAPEMRHTDDVDVIVEATSRSDYYHIEDRLRELGFVQRHEPGDPLCRWTVGNVIVDLMATDEAILGFGNRWYKAAIQHSETMTIEPELTVRVITAPYFIATKMEAFRNRGKNDFLGSRDIADIVSVLDGRSELPSEIALSEEALETYIVATCLAYLDRPDFREGIAGHMLPDAISQQRVSFVLEQIRQITML